VHSICLSADVSSLGKIHLCLVKGMFTLAIWHTKKSTLKKCTHVKRLCRFFWRNLETRRKLFWKSIDIQLLFLSWPNMPCRITRHHQISYVMSGMHPMSWFLMHTCTLHSWHVSVANIAPWHAPHLFPYCHITHKNITYSQVERVNWWSQLGKITK